MTEEKVITTTSSNIASFEYSRQRSVLTVEFKNGAKWEYSKVPPQIFEGMRDAESKGAYFRSRVKGYFDERKVEG